MDVSGEHFPRLWSALASCLRVFVSSCLWIRKLPQCRDASSHHFQDISMQLPEQAKQSRAQWRRMLSVRGSFPCEASISIEVSRSAALTYWSEPIGLVDATRTMSRLCRQPRCDLGLSSFRSRLNLDSCWAAAEPETCGTFHSVATWKSTPWISFSNLSDWLISKMNRANTFHQDFLWRIFDTRGKGLTTNSPRIGGNGKICIPQKKCYLKHWFRVDFAFKINLTHPGHPEYIPAIFHWQFDTQ